MSWKNDQVSEGETKEIVRLAREQLAVPGDFVEMGCYKGDTSLLLAEVLQRGARPRSEMPVVEKPVENSEKEEAIFDGYVAESTDTRVRLSGAAVEVWSQSVPSALFGVGLGGAGYALYNNGLSPAPKEIVQNEYASLLLETGLIGVSLLVLTLVLIVRMVWIKPQRVMLISLLVAYGISLMFFSGLPNALHIYLVSILLILDI